MPPKRKASAAVERLPITTEPADNGRKGKKLKEAILLVRILLLIDCRFSLQMANMSSLFRCFDVQITKSCLTPLEALKLCESTGFEGIVSSSDISKALDPLISEGAKAWIRP
jgi:hypothetical protein